jgi:hypothetical protein
MVANSVEEVTFRLRKFRPPVCFERGRLPSSLLPPHGARVLQVG